MAEENPELDLAQKRGGKKWLWVALVLAAVAVSSYIGMGFIGGGQAIAKETATAGGHGAAGNKPAAALYVPMDTYLINFAHNGTLHYLQMSASIMARDDLLVEALKKHMPAIRDAIINNLIGLTYEDISTKEGKKSIQSMMLGQIRQVLKAESVAGEAEAVYVTAFVMQ